jgi:solute:Na+ symporter, SSS family
MVYSGTGGTCHPNGRLLLANPIVLMNYFDWIVLLTTILAIVLYGTWKTRKTTTVEGYLRADNSMKWWMIGVSIMATQASAVTFLSTPGQAIEDGMRFLQFYFGLPLAMVIISITFVPIYYKLKVYTAYEYLETRFDLKTRTLAAILFLLLRGLSAGITLFAPALVLSTILGWPISITTIMIGSLVIVYVVSGGTKAVSLTQRYQMAVIMGGMVLAGILAYSLLPQHVSFSDSMHLAGELGKFNLVNLNFNLTDRYNIWSGLVAGTFLFLAYFGTDQSQVARYLGGSSLTQSRLGLLFNGLLKIPMQFIILFIGVLVFLFFLFHQPPVFHNQVLLEEAKSKGQTEQFAELEKNYDEIFASKRIAVDNLVASIQAEDQTEINVNKEQVLMLQRKEIVLRDSVKRTISAVLPAAKVQDRDYIFLNFVLTHLPHGIIGLLLAVMFSAAMSSMAGELNALASTTVVDIYKRFIGVEASSQQLLNRSRLFTILWALLAMVFAMLASFAENLIQFVNIVGSLFYGTLLGIFLTAFYIKRVKGTAVFIGAIISELIIFYCYVYTEIAFLLYNLIACAAVILFSISVQLLLPEKSSR